MTTPLPFGGLNALRREAEATARAHAGAGGKVCGYLSHAIPVEMIEAAGFSPLQMSAGDVSATPLADHYMESLFDDQVRGVFERILRGDFDYLSAIMLPRAGDSVHRLYYYLSEIARVGGAKLPPVLLFDVVQTPGAASDDYSAGRIAHLWDQLRGLGDGGAGDDALRAAVEASNARIALLNDFASRRRLGGVSGEAALGVFAAARVLPHAQFAAELLEWLAATSKPDAPRKPRVVIAGSPHDDSGLHALVEDLGGEVVGDFHGAGELSIGAAMDAGGPPLQAIMERYRSGVMGQRSFGDPARAIADFAKAAGADAVVFSYVRVEEALTWDYPEQVRALKAAGVETLRLGAQARPFDAAAAKIAVAGLLRALGVKA